MLNRLVSLLLIGCCAALFVPAAAAQYPNLDTIEGPSEGETTTLMISPYSLTDDVSIRAFGVESPTSTRFALTLIGAARSDSIGLTLNGNPLPIEEIERPPEDEIGPTHVYVSQKTFLTLADRSGVRLHIGDATAQLTDQVRKEMRRIFEKVT